MKTCKNCGTQNEVTVVKCISCTMEGHFTLHVAEEPKPAAPTEKEQCMNCGEIHQAEGTHCIHCHFPRKRVELRNMASYSVPVNRKTG
ncbi:MAG: hypothetical protein AAFO94_04140 [Bacteroidota bacterium]